ncbi:MAG: Re/Si-specific NAD(P)(+) transhydrogenase subunit alpha [Synechococcales cyanobacterium RM1_1_8]|nr:Re/Si-specific NAD(P)(+) transhydrogenase subunit alpha [Synechococcales cyanobacterium RM1_1_8]
MTLVLGIPKELEDEQRVALVPDVVGRLVKQGLEVWVEPGAGLAAGANDTDYEAAGAQVVPGDRLWAEANLVLTVAASKTLRERSDCLEKLGDRSVLIGFLDPLGDAELAQLLADKGVTSFSMEMVPRISRAQSMDALSSQASIGGYKAVLLAAAGLPKYFPMLTTAAGTIAPAKVLVVGAGVAGLQAIATARRLGAVVESFDIRPEVKEQVQSLGANFIDITFEEETRAEGGYAKELSQAAQEHTQNVLKDHVQRSDVVITTAQVPGKRAPRIVTEDMVNGMKPGSIIVDMAANQGGNCAYSEAGRTIIHNGVTILGPTNLPSTVAIHASQLYAKNIQALLKLLVKDGELDLNFEDEIVKGACLTHGGEIQNARVKSMLEPTAV